MMMMVMVELRLCDNLVTFRSSPVKEAVMSTVLCFALVGLVAASKLFIQYEHPADRLVRELVLKKR